MTTLPRSAERSSRWGWIALATLALGLALACLGLLFTTFMPYDDEGYVLISLKHFGEQGGLYDRVYTQYGPFFFVASDALQRLWGFEWTHTSSRLLTLAYWMGAAVACAALVWTRSRSTAATAFTLAGVVLHLWVMISEPGHPGGMIVLLVALAAWMGGRRSPAQSRLSATALGALGAALALIKINVGAFVLIATFTWLVVHAADARVRRTGSWVVMALVMLLPWALMRPLLSHGWVQTFALIATLGIAGAILAARSAAQATASGKLWLCWLAGGVALALPTLAVLLARGTSPEGLLAGVLLDPLRHPGVYFYRVEWRAAALPVAVCGLALTLWAVRRPVAPGMIQVAAAVRALGALWYGASQLLVLPELRAFAEHAFPPLLTLLPINPAEFGMSFGVGLAAVCALGLRRDADGRRDASTRQWLALVLALQFLHAYPVAGSQCNWATFLWVPLLALALRDAWLALAPGMRARVQFVPAAAAVAAFGLAGLIAVMLLETGASNRQQGEPLGLPGAERLVLPDQMTFALRVMCDNVRAHADVLFSVPGRFSLNLWAQRPTPTAANVTLWDSLLSLEQQEAIIARMRDDPRAVVVKDIWGLRTLESSGFHPRGPLAAYLASHFEQAFEVDRYALWVHGGRRVAALSTGKLSALPGAGQRLRRLELVLALPARPIASIEVWAMREETREHRYTLSEESAHLDLTPLDDSGSELGATQPHAWSAPLPGGIVRLGVEFRGKRPSPTDLLLAFVLDAEGRRVAAARVFPASSSTAAPSRGKTEG